MQGDAPILTKTSLCRLLYGVFSAEPLSQVSQRWLVSQFVASSSWWVGSLWVCGGRAKRV